jgi:3-oxoacyl-[acyl-carrier protein] reductase
VNRLRDKVTLVTGSSRGIGAAIAARFAREGAKVALHGRDAAALSDVRAEIKWAGGCTCQVTADLTKFREIEDMRQRVERELGPIDILVANAGGNVAKPGPIEHTSEEEWRAALDGNLTATFLTVKSILPGMKERKAGNIITISSAAARRPHPGSPVAYAAAKAGIEIFTQDLAAQVGPYGIRGKLHSARNDPHRTQQKTYPCGAAGCVARTASDPPAWDAGRRGARRALSCLRRCVVDRRNHLRRRRRRGHGVNSTTAPLRALVVGSILPAQLPRKPSASAIHAPP